MRRFFRARLARRDPLNDQGREFIGALGQRAHPTGRIGRRRWLFDRKGPLRPNAFAFESGSQAQHAAAALGPIEHLLELKELGTQGVARWIVADRADFAGGGGGKPRSQSLSNNAAGDMTHWL